MVSAIAELIGSAVEDAAGDLEDPLGRDLAVEGAAERRGEDDGRGQAGGPGVLGHRLPGGDLDGGVDALVAQGEPVGDDHDRGHLVATGRDRTVQAAPVEDQADRVSSRGSSRTSAITASASAICGTRSGCAKAVTSIRRTPASRARRTSVALSSVETDCFSFCSPSRGETSTIWTSFTDKAYRIYDHVMTTLPSGPLAGVRVLEAGQLLAGPFAATLMADQGADVIKVEAPGVGDPMRQWGRTDGTSLWWPVVGRNKRTVTLNLREEEGQELFLQLVAKSDIIVENFRGGTFEKWNLSYERLREVNPGIILVRVTGYGQTGPYSSRAGYGSIGEAMGGLRYILGDPDRQPSRAGISIGDSLAAMHATVGALSALQHRHLTGEGQVVDASIYESVLAMMESLVTEWDQAGYQRERTGAILPNVAPSNVYPTKDGQLILIAANQDSVSSRLFKMMGRAGVVRAGSRVLHARRPGQGPGAPRRADLGVDRHRRRRGGSSR